MYDWLLALCSEHRNYITSIAWELIAENGIIYIHNCFRINYVIISVKWHNRISAQFPTIFLFTPCAEISEHNEATQKNTPAVFQFGAISLRQCRLALGKCLTSSEESLTSLAILSWDTMPARSSWLCRLASSLPCDSSYHFDIYSTVSSHPQKRAPIPPANQFIKPTRPPICCGFGLSLQKKQTNPQWTGRVHKPVCGRDVNRLLFGDDEVGPQWIDPSIEPRNPRTTPPKTMLNIAAAILGVVYALLLL